MTKEDLSSNRVFDSTKSKEISRQLREGIKTVILMNVEALNSDIVFKEGGLDNVLSYLHSQGVVIKEEGELPENPWHQDGIKYRDGLEDQRIVYERAQQDMLKAGYTKWSPLIRKEKTNDCN